MTETKPRRQRRTKASIVASIEQAAECEIAQNGFISSLVTSIIRKAKIEPQVFYNRYTDISDFYDNFVKKYDYWLTEIIKKIQQPVETEEGMRTLFSSILTSLNEDPVVLELVRWELFEKNPTTIRTSTLREMNMQPLTQDVVYAFNNSDIDVVALFAIVVGGVYYLSLHKKLSPFYGIDPGTEQGRERIMNSVTRLIGMVHDARARANREAEIQHRLLKAGVGRDIIEAAFAKE